MRSHKVKATQSCVTLWPHGLYSPWNFPGQNTGVGSFSLLQGIFPTQGSNPGLLHCRQILYQLSHKGSTKILEWVAYPFSSGSAWPRNQSRVSCIPGGCFISWATREAQRWHGWAIIQSEKLPTHWETSDTEAHAQSWWEGSACKPWRGCALLTSSSWACSLWSCPRPGIFYDSSPMQHVIMKNRLHNKMTIKNGLVINIGDIRLWWFQNFSHKELTVGGLWRSEQPQDEGMTRVMKEDLGLPWGLSGKETACRCRRHRFDPPSGKIPQAAEQLSLCAQLLSRGSSTQELSYWSPRAWSRCSAKEKPHPEDGEDREHQLERSPAHCSRRKPTHKTDPGQPNVNK